MGVDHSILLVCGIKLASSQLQEEYEVPSCYHPQPDTKPKYCAECGGLNRIEKRSRFKPAFKDWNNTDEVLGYDFVLSSYYGDGDYFLGNVIRFNTNDGSMKVSIPDLNKLKRNMMTDLAPLGLWNEKTFGVWLVNRWT